MHMHTEFLVRGVCDPSSNVKNMQGIDVQRFLRDRNFTLYVFSFIFRGKLSFTGVASVTLSFHTQMRKGGM